MIKIPVRALSVEDLKNRTTPGYTKKGQSEAVFHTIYDTATFTNATVALQFFNAGRASRQLTNFNGRGMFPAKEAFQPIALTVDIMIVPGALGVGVDTISQMWNLQFGSGVAGVGAPIIEIEYSNKTYGPFKLSQAHGTGGPHGFHTVNNFSFANNSLPDGGIWLGDSVIFAPLQNFTLDILWQTPYAALPANINIQPCIHGILHRAVL